MNKKLAILSILTSIVVSASIFSGCAKAGSSNEIKIGVVLPLTGEIATYGQSSKNALDLLQEQVNKAGGVLGKNIKLVYEDDENQPTKSTNAITKLIDSEKVSAIIGSVSSGACIAIGPIATKNKIPMITPTATSEKVTTDGGEYVFRSCYIDSFQGMVVAKYAAEDLKAKKAAIFYDLGSDYSKGLADTFEKVFKEKGGTIVAKEAYNTTDKDFKAQLTKIKGLDPEVIFLPEYYNAVGLIATQARALGIKAVLMGADGWDSDKLVEVGGDAINGGYFSNHYSPDDTAKEVVDFIKSYKAKYGENKTPDALAVLAYDAGKILFEAIKNANSTDGAKIKDALKATNLSVVAGNITFDSNRNPIKGAVIIKMEAGKQKFVKKVNP